MGSPWGWCTHSLGCCIHLGWATPFRAALGGMVVTGGGRGIVVVAELLNHFQENINETLMLSAKRSRR